jgi:DNA modification methylase
MGSGMLPAGAYVTLEHEWILIFRKGNKRLFKSGEEKLKRKESSFFWSERNLWFSDVWDLKGTKQTLNNSETRNRSAAYPFEIPYRLINMYSLKGDTIVDPFLGTGTSTIAAICSERNSIGYEIDSKFHDIINQNILTTPIEGLNRIIDNRINQQKNFIKERISDTTKNEIKHYNSTLKMPVMTSQETDIQFSYIKDIKSISENEIEANYVSLPEDNEAAG